MDIRSVQQQAWANKVSKGFNTADVPTEFMLLLGEANEAFDAWRHGRATEIGEELADIAIYVCGLAEMLGVDLDQAVEEKLARNARRTYERDGHGVMVRVDEESPG